MPLQNMFEFSGVESYNYIGVGERYHTTLNRILTIARKRHLSMCPKVTLMFALKSMNGTMGPE